MVDAGTVGAVTGYGLLALACAAALWVAARLRSGDGWREPREWLAVRLVGTVALVALAAAVEVGSFEQPSGSVSDLFVMAVFALAGAVFLVDLPFHLSHPRALGPVRDRPWLPWSVLAVPLTGLVFVLFAWPGRAPVTFQQGTEDPALMSQWRAWSARYDLVEDTAMWFLVASLALAIGALVLVQGWRAVRGDPAERGRARRMLGQAFVGPAAWALAAGLVAAIAAAGVSSLATPLSFASGLLFEPGLPASFLLLGPLLWARDELAHGRPNRSPDPGPQANPS